MTDSNMPEAIILCGGAGLRLRSVIGDNPKSLATVADRPFLDLLLRQLQRHGARRVVLAVGHGQDAIRAHLSGLASDLDIQYSVESSPLGTGGAIAQALALIRSETALVMNGDSYTGVDLAQFVEQHRRVQAEVSVVVVPIAGRTDCGSVRVDAEHKIVGFEEKQAQPDSPYANAGIYLLRRQLFKTVLPGAPVSLERELLPLWLDQGHDLRAFVHPGPCIDIGTPERYEAAQRVLAAVESEENLGPEKRETPAAV